MQWRNPQTTQTNPKYKCFFLDTITWAVTMKGRGKKIIFTPSLSPKPKLGQNLMLSICAFRAVKTGETTHSAQKCHQFQKMPRVSLPSREGNACNHLHTWTRPPRYSLALDCLWRPWLVSPLLSVDLLLVSVSEWGHTQQTWCRWRL